MGRVRRKTNEYFINELIEIYGELYDYSKVNYNSKEEPVTLICKEHGEFQQTPDSLLKGYACQECTKENKRKEKFELFLEEANKIYNGKYDYSKADFINKATPIKIICPIHGEFERTPQSHLNGAGCDECKRIDLHNRFAKDEETFLNELKAIYGDNYDYSNVKYYNQDTEVILICKKHGEFSKSPKQLLNGHGCKKCGFESMAKSKTKTLDSFLERAILKHGDKYDYSKTDYIGEEIPTTITCRIHGDFQITPKSHLRGCGCYFCGIDSLTKKQMKPLNQFIIDAINVHGDRYTYENAEYNGARRDLLVTCKKHGDFPITPNELLNGYGCPYCNSSKMEEKVMVELWKNGIAFEYQKTFEWLKNKKNLLIDVFIPEYNIGIECQGLQHFKPVKFSNSESDKQAEERFGYIQLNDKLKYELCLENGIKIFYINYNENIKEKLGEILKENNISYCDDIVIKEDDIKISNRTKDLIQRLYN